MGAILCAAKLKLGGKRKTGVSTGVQAERHALEACVLEMAGKSAALKQWLADNEKKAVTGRSPACLCRTSSPVNDLPCVGAFWS